MKYLNPCPTPASPPSTEDGGRAEPVEDQLGRLDALVAELLQPGHRDRQPGQLRDLGLLLDDEAGHARVRRVGGRVGLREQQDDARAPAVRDPHLLAADHVVVAVADRRRPDRLDVGARVRLGHREGRAHLAGREPRQEPLLLLLRAVVPDHPAGDEAAVDDPGQRRPAPRELDHDQRVGVEPQAEAAVAFGDRHAEQAELPHLADERRRGTRRHARARTRPGSPPGRPSRGSSRRSRSARPSPISASHRDRSRAR